MWLDKKLFCRNYLSKPWFLYILSREINRYRNSTVPHNDGMPGTSCCNYHATVVGFRQQPKQPDMSQSTPRIVFKTSRRYSVFGYRTRMFPYSIIKLKLEDAHRGERSEGRRQQLTLCQIQNTCLFTQQTFRILAQHNASARCDSQQTCASKTKPAG